jgi:hypothetical protein
MVDFDEAPDVFKMVFYHQIFFFQLYIYENHSLISIFIFLKLNTASAPQFIIFRKGKPKPADHFDMSRYVTTVISWINIFKFYQVLIKFDKNRVGFSADQIAKWVNDRAEINVS